MGNALPEVHRKRMIEAMKKRADGFGSILEETTRDGIYSVRCTFSGTADHVNEGFQAFFGGNASLEYAGSRKISFESSLSGSVSDLLDFAGFLNAPEQTLITARLSVPDHEFFSDGSHALNALFTGGICRLSDTVSSRNPMRVLLMVLLILAGLLAIYWFITDPLQRYLAVYGSGGERKKPGSPKGKNTSGGAAVRKAAAGQKAAPKAKTPVRKTPPSSGRKEKR